MFLQVCVNGQFLHKVQFIMPWGQQFMMPPQIFNQISSDEATGAGY